MRDLDRYLGNGGMPLLDVLGVGFTEYGEGWAEATWAVTAGCTNPAGVVQAGVHGVVLDAAMYFALVAALEKGEHGATLQMSVQTLQPAHADDVLAVRGTTSRVARSVAYCSAEIRRGDVLIATGHGAFAVKRPEGPAA